MRIVVLGTVRFTAACLDTLVASDLAPVAVLCRRRSPGNADFADLGVDCMRLGIPACYVDKLAGEEEARLLAELRPDVLLVLGWPFLVAPQVRGLARVVIGAHPAPLPVGRGRHPIVWAIALGLRETALSFFELVDAADAGPLYLQTPIPIDDVDDAGTLYAKIESTARSDLPKVVAGLRDGTLRASPQDESRAIVWRRRTSADGRIDWRMSSLAIDRLVRALTRPYVGAQLELEGRLARVWKVQIVNADDAWSAIEPGRVLAVTGSVVRVRTGDGAVDLVEHELSGLPVAGDSL